MGWIKKILPATMPKMVFYTAIKKMEILLFETIWLDPGGTG